MNTHQVWYPVPVLSKFNVVGFLLSLWSWMFVWIWWCKVWTDRCDINKLKTGKDKTPELHFDLLFCRVYEHSNEARRGSKTVTVRFSFASVRSLKSFTLRFELTQFPPDSDPSVSSCCERRKTATTRHAALVQHRLKHAPWKWNHTVVTEIQDDEVIYFTQRFGSNLRDWKGPTF